MTAFDSIILDRVWGPVPNVLYEAYAMGRRQALGEGGVVESVNEMLDKLTPEQAQELHATVWHLSQQAHEHEAQNQCRQVPDDEVVYVQSLYTTKP